MPVWPAAIRAITLFVEDLDEFGHTLINLLKSSAAIELVGPATVGEADSGPRMQFTIHWGQG